MIRSIAMFLSGAFSVVSFVLYMLAIVRREVKPAKASWIVWCVLDLMTFFGMWAEHTLNVQVGVVAISSVVIAILSHQFGVPGWTRLDKLCMFGAAVGILAWLRSGNALFGIVSGIVWNVVGAIPMFEAAWRNPHHERSIAWPLGTVACILTCVLCRSLSLAEFGQPLTFLGLNLCIIFLVYVRPALKLRTV